MIEAIIFDMDGLLIDSEPSWKKAEKEAYKTVGIEMSPDMLRETTGLRETEAVKYWFRKKPWDGPSVEELADRITKRTVELVITEGKFKPGATEAIKLAKDTGLPVALASSSDLEMIHVVLDKMGVREDMTLIHSAEDEEYGKPHPAVYITTAKKLSVEPSHCLAIEDSPNGVLSAKAARMKVIAVPEPEFAHRQEIALADIVLESLTELNKEMLK